MNQGILSHVIYIFRTHFIYNLKTLNEPSHNLENKSVLYRDLFILRRLNTVTSKKD